MSTSQSRKRPRNNSGNGRPSVRFGPGTVKSFKYGSFSGNGNISVPSNT